MDSEKNVMEIVIDTLSSYQNQKEKYSEGKNDTQPNAPEVDVNKFAPFKASKTKVQSMNIH